MKSVTDFAVMKKLGQPISMLTCYDSYSAEILERSSVDCILIGDSVGMVLHGMPGTERVTIDIMELHVKAVASRLYGKKLLIADMPFMSCRKGKYKAVKYAETLIRAGANAIKLEGGIESVEIVRYIKDSGIPVLGHLGLMPQYFNDIGGWKIRGKTEDERKKIRSDAFALQEAGCCALILECVVEDCATNLSQELEIPIIGIGSGSRLSGQVLVLHDVIGASSNNNLTFVKKYGNVANETLKAVESFCSDVRDGLFPEQKHAFSINQITDTVS